MTTEQAAERLGVSPQRVRMLIKEERLPATRLGRDWLVNEKDLKLVAVRKPGRPPKKKK